MQKTIVPAILSSIKQILSSHKTKQWNVEYKTMKSREQKMGTNTWRNIVPAILSSIQLIICSLKTDHLQLWNRSSTVLQHKHKRDKEIYNGILRLHLVHKPFLWFLFLKSWNKLTFFFHNWIQMNKYCNDLLHNVKTEKHVPLEEHKKTTVSGGILTVQ